MKAASAALALSCGARSWAAPTELSSTTYDNGGQAITHALWDGGAPLNWEQADAYAVNGGGELASIHNDAEAVVIAGLAAGYTAGASSSAAYAPDGGGDLEGPYLAGFRIVNNQPGFGWSDGTPFDYANWSLDPLRPDLSNFFIQLFASGTTGVTGPIASPSDRGVEWTDGPSSPAATSSPSPRSRSSRPRRPPFPNRRLGR